MQLDGYAKGVYQDILYSRFFPKIKVAARKHINSLVASQKYFSVNAALLRSS